MFIEEATLSWLFWSQLEGHVIIYCAKKGMLRNRVLSMVLPSHCHLDLVVIGRRYVSGLLPLYSANRTSCASNFLRSSSFSSTHRNSIANTVSMPVHSNISICISIDLICRRSSTSATWTIMHNLMTENITIDAEVSLTRRALVA